MAEHNATPVPETIVHTRALELDPATPTVGFDHPYFEIAWLPQIGPTSWLLWRTIGTRLVERGEVLWTAGMLARRHGIHVPVLFRTFIRLAQFRILRTGDSGEVFLPPACIPLGPRQLQRADPDARRLHTQTFARPRT